MRIRMRISPKIYFKNGYRTGKKLEYKKHILFKFKIFSSKLILTKVTEKTKKSNIFHVNFFTKIYFSGWFFYSLDPDPSLDLLEGWRKSRIRIRITTGYFVMVVFWGLGHEKIFFFYSLKKDLVVPFIWNNFLQNTTVELGWNQTFRLGCLFNLCKQMTHDTGDKDTQVLWYLSLTARNNGLKV